MYECEWGNEEETASKVNNYECAILNDFELCNVHAEIEKWSILSTQVDYAV